MLYKSAPTSNRIIRLAVAEQPTEVYNDNPSMPVFNTSFKHQPHIMGAVQSAFKALPRPFQEHFVNTGIPMSHPSISKHIDYNPGDDRQRQFHDVFGKTSQALSSHLNNAYNRSLMKHAYHESIYGNPVVLRNRKFSTGTTKENSPFTNKPIADNKEDVDKHIGDLTHAFLRHVHTGGLHNKPFEEQLNSFHNKLSPKFPITANLYRQHMLDMAKTLSKQHA